MPHIGLIRLLHTHLHKIDLTTGNRPQTDCISLASVSGGLGCADVAACAITKQVCVKGQVFWVDQQRKRMRDRQGHEEALSENDVARSYLGSSHRKRAKH